MLRFEHRRQKLAPPHRFFSRLAKTGMVVLLLTLISLLVGMAGYARFEGMGAVDAFANAAMILSGMGPLSPMLTMGGKVFAGIYALYSGFFVLVMAGLLLAPVAHRFLHRFHLEDGRG
jgi:hypothetical protein